MAPALAPALALAPSRRHSRCPDAAARSWYDVHHGHRGSIRLAQESSGVAACQQREDTTLQRSQPVGDDQHLARRRVEAKQYAITE